METELKTERRHYPLPDANLVESNIAAVLNGDVASLWGAFLWHGTPQEHEFWSAQVDDGELTAEGRAILESWLEQLGGKVPDAAKLRAALEFYTNPGDFKVGGAVWLDCGSVARAALRIEVAV
jgi:hypothetical protein